MADIVRELGREEEEIALLSCAPSLPIHTENNVVKSWSDTARLQIKEGSNWNRRAGRSITRPTEERTGNEVSSLRIGFEIQSKVREESMGSRSIREMREETEFGSEGNVVKLMAEP